MTPKRAKEIIEQAQESAVYGPWSDQLRKVMTSEEIEFTNQVWSEMPGYTCFVDALYKICKEEYLQLKEKEK